MIQDDPFVPVRPQAIPVVTHRPRSIYGDYSERGIVNVAGFGSTGAATFVLVLEPGAKVTYVWQTAIFKSYSGNEQRLNTSGPMPSRHFEGTVSLLDPQDRDLRSALVRSTPSGQQFALALPFEELVFSADSAGNITFFASTAGADWAVATQRVVVVGSDGSTMLGVVQEVTATTIRLDVVVGALGRAGGRIMPLVQVLLDPQQGFARYPNTVGLWAIKSTAAVFGWIGTDVMGRGAQVVTYTAGLPVAASTLVEDDVLVWDRPNFVDGTANESMLSLADLIDYGGVPFSGGGAVVPDWVRAVRYSSSDPAEFQWLKAFLRFVRGRQKSWLLPTNHADLLFVSTTVGGIKISSSSIAGAGDYTAWFNSLAHRRLSIVTSDGATQYVTVTGVTDNHDGTLTLALSVGVIGSVTKISFLEQVRFDNNDSDDLAVTWDGGTFSIDWTARTTQETLVPPFLFSYDAFKLLVVAFGPPPPPPPTDGAISAGTGQAIYVKLLTDRSFSFGSITLDTGVLDGIVVTVTCENNSALGINLLHEDASWPAFTRLWNPGLATISGTNKSATYVYNLSAQRWICIDVT